MTTRVERFGQAVRDARRSLNLSLEEVADQMGWNPSTLSKYERGKRKSPPEPEQVIRLEEILELTDGSLQRAAGYQVRRAGRQSLSYGGPPLTPDEEADVLEFIEFKRAQRDRG